MDESVICPVFDDQYQQKPEVYHHNDTMQLTGHNVQMIERYNEKYDFPPINVKIDCDGLGVGVYDRLKEIVKQRKWKNVKVYECHFGGRGGRLKADDPVNYSNSSGLMWGTLRERLRKNIIVLWYDDKQMSQISNRKYYVNSDGEIEIERKEDMKKRGLKSPDRADALVLALWKPFKIFARSSSKI